MWRVSFVATQDDNVNVVTARMHQYLYGCPRWIVPAHDAPRRLRLRSRKLSFTFEPRPQPTSAKEIDLLRKIEDGMKSNIAKAINAYKTVQASYAVSFAASFAPDSPFFTHEELPQVTPLHVDPCDCVTHGYWRSRKEIALPSEDHESEEEEEEKAGHQQDVDDANLPWPVARRASTDNQEESEEAIAFCRWMRDMQTTIDMVVQGRCSDTHGFSILSDALRGKKDCYFGGSLCRLCGSPNGGNEYVVQVRVSLTKWSQLTWPSGLLHYYLDHDVAPDPTFVAFWRTYLMKE